MEWLFGKKLTPEELLRKNQRALNKAMRDLDREKQKMEQQEKKIINDIKKLAKEGQMVCILLLSISPMSMQIAKQDLNLLNTYIIIYSYKTVREPVGKLRCSRYKKI